MDIQSGSSLKSMHSQVKSVLEMTHSKDSNAGVENNSWSWWEIFHKHSDKAIKACVAVLAVLCVCLIVITITMASRPAKISENGIKTELQERSLPALVRESTDDACELIEMSVVCQNTSKIYSDVYNTLLTVPFNENIILNIESQHFPNYILANNWISSGKDIRRITISNSYFTNIRNEAFNCVDFTKTSALKLVGVKLPFLTNGVLLGLSKLLYLHITGSIGRIHRCFFQPVQSSLVRIKLSAGLNFPGDENIFGISILPWISVLDLSDNEITGVISRSFFTAVPGVKCVTLSNSKIKAIDEYAFDDIAENLEILDLSNNLLTAIDVVSVERILKYGKVNIYLLGNSWLCKCQLKPLITLYDKYESRFGDIPYCIGPPDLYGVLFTNVSFDADCSSNSIEEPLYEISSSDESTAEFIPPSILNTTVMPSITTDISMEPFFQMRCLSLVSLPDDDDADSSDQTDYFHFDPPCHEFDVTLLTNNSVKISVQNAEEPINIVWFSDCIENFAYTIEGITVDYSCDGYGDPYLIIDDLFENCTYTFCLVPMESQSITPFNCLPLHVPITTRDDDMIWISTENKQFTVTVVCIIFGCSILLGGATAYFGIKSYPDLLEGSRHVLVVKRSDQTCYVSTITEGEYIINQKSRKKSLKKIDSIKKVPLARVSFDPLPEIPSSNLLTSFQLPIPNTVESTDENDDHYELPAIYNKIHECNLKCIPNKYATSPTSPPPLPKRNSDNALYSPNLEFSGAKSYPKMSF